MPPAISDDEGSETNELAVVTPPKREKKAVSYTEAKEEDDDSEPTDTKEETNGDASNDAAEDDDEDGGDGEDGEEYVVEKILSHMIVEDGTPRYEVKWEGFEKKSDRTWEPEENLRGTADSILDEYLEKIGGHRMLFNDNQKAKQTKKRGRPNHEGTPTGSAKKSRKHGNHPLDTEPPASRKVAWKPPPGSWENDILSVDMSRDDSGELVVWLGWNNGQKTQHKAQQAYTRCPQKMLKFYESKINFTSS